MQEPKLCDICNRSILKQLHINLIASPPVEYYKIINHSHCNKLRQTRMEIIDELNDIDYQIALLRSPPQ
jgi:hypothetical protein